MRKLWHRFWRLTVLRNWYWLLSRTIWRLYEPGVTRGPVARWWFKRQHGRPCSDEIITHAWRDRRRDRA